MTSPLNIPAILIANIMGISLLVTVTVVNKWRLKNNSRKNRLIAIMAASCLFNSILDPLGFLMEGHAGRFVHVFIKLENTLLFLSGFVLPMMLVFLVAEQLSIKLHKVHRIILWSLLGVFIVALIVNLFTPILFTVSEDNYYARAAGYAVPTVLDTLLILDGVVLYFIYRRKSGGLKFFPMWAFIIPTILGIAIQTFLYGVSTITPFGIVSLVCVVICLQNEQLYRDQLTGLYNRFYLNIMEKKMRRSEKRRYAAMMLDLNGFKHINDAYGHAAGDEALKHTAAILTEAVGASGEILRYAGDEFIIILNAEHDDHAKQVAADIQKGLDAFNLSGKTPYRLSISVGYRPINPKLETMDEFMDKIDKLMYENKREHYAQHDRRKSDRNLCKEAP